jgi:hypothetical protein
MGVQALREHPSRRATSVTRCARLQQLNPAPSPLLQLLGASLWSHGREYRARHQMPITYAHFNKNVAPTLRATTQITLHGVPGPLGGLEVRPRSRE